MTTTKLYSVQRLMPDDAGLMQSMLGMFAEAFEDTENYSAARPGASYIARLLKSGQFIALAAMEDDAVVGGLAAYILQKFEQERSEVYIYDLAVAVTHRRRGIATALIEALKPIAADAGAHVIFVQADLGDDPAIALCSKLGAREDVLHFDIAVE